MGYGANLKKILDEKGITIKDLSQKTSIVTATLHSIVQRYSSVRYDSALKIAEILCVLTSDKHEMPQEKILRHFKTYHLYTTLF